MSLTLEIVTPEALAYSSEVDMVVIPGTEGDFGVLPHHINFVSSIRIGVVEVTQHGNNNVSKYFTSGGIVEVADNRCTILATDATLVEELDINAAKEHIEAANLILNEASSSKVARSKAEKDKEIAEKILEVIG